MADELTLLPCPACWQARAYYTSRVRIIADGLWYAVACNACGHRTAWYDTRAEADAAWRTRVPDPALAAAQARIAELEITLREAIRACRSGRRIDLAGYDMREPQVNILTIERWASVLSSPYKEDA